MANRRNGNSIQDGGGAKVVQRNGNSMDFKPDVSPTIPPTTIVLFSKTFAIPPKGG